MKKKCKDPDNVERSSQKKSAVDNSPPTDSLANIPTANKYSLLRDQDEGNIQDHEIDSQCHSIEEDSEGEGWGLFD